jgi:hypothetical protein
VLDHPPEPLHPWHEDRHECLLRNLTANLNDRLFELLPGLTSVIDEPFFQISKEAEVTWGATPAVSRMRQAFGLGRRDAFLGRPEL